MSDTLYGLLAEFDDPDRLVAATRRVRLAGYRKIDAFAPYPIDDLADALDFRDAKTPLIVLAGGIIGCIGGYLLQYWASAIAYPVNVGGKPLNSWPAFVPVTFETAILVAALAAVIGMLALNGLPMPYHPLFNVGRFAHVTQDGFFLCVEAADPRYDHAATRRLLESLGPREVYDVPS
jgi:ActD protein